MAERKNTVFIVIYAVAALAFLVLLAMGVSGIGRTALKAIPVITLLALVVRGVRGFPGVCLSGALIGSVAGDILLDLPYPGLFIFGLVSFLVAHLFYTVLFFRYAKRPDRVQKTVIGALVLLASAMIWIFRVVPPALYGTVVIYIVAIITMSVGALLVPAENRLLFAGALLFIASDIVLAVNKFLVVVPYGRVLNISPYFTAQCIMITAALALWSNRKGLTLIFP